MKNKLIKDDKANEFDKNISELDLKLNEHNEFNDVIRDFVYLILIIAGVAFGYATIVTFQ